jgi:hypothetical protein
MPSVLDNNNFLLNKLVVLQGCSGWLLKNLKPGEYVFSNLDYDGFYGKRVNLSAIVGMNGSGKSSLLELVFRMVNNVGVMMAQHMDNPELSPYLYYVMGIYADLHYTIDGNHYVLKSRGGSFGLDLGEKKIQFGTRDVPEFSHYDNYNKATLAQLREISKYFFYTVVNNYSIQAYDAHDYARDLCAKMYHGVCHYQDDNVSWINNVFHKNDGYTTPITLNPYRHDGNIDMQNEAVLTEQRLAAILLEFRSRGYDFLPDYSLSAVNYKLDREKLLSGIDSVNEDYVGFPFVEKEKRSRTDSAALDLDKKMSRVLGELKVLRNNRDSFASVVMNRFGIMLEEDADDLLWMTALYIIKKVLQIGATYPQYSEFNDVSRSGPMRIAESKEERQQISRLCKHVKKDRSHIKLKIWQSLNFLSKAKDKDLSLLRERFSYDDYVMALWNGQLQVNSVAQRMNLLPPSFFTDEIMMRENTSGHTVPIGRMSSGERQFMYSMSALVYHALNILSVRQSDRIGYSNILMVLDEVEICYHPEYQRTLIYYLMNVLKQSDISSRGSVYVLMTTHSPFILSDIPKDNILYLKDGVQQDSEAFINPFCANVNDILKQSFFLSEGFIGRYAQKKIEGLMRFLTGYDEGRGKIEMSNAQKLINLVGDPVIKENLQEMLDEFLEAHPQYDTRDRKKERIKELKRQLRELEANGANTDN